MKNTLLFFCISLIIGGLLISAGFTADKKLAQTGFQFLSVPIDARPVAMGEAFTTVAGNATSVFHNPANMALMTSFIDIGLNQNKWIADIDYISGCIAVNPLNGQFGTFAVSVLSVNYGEFLGTMVDPNSDKGYMDTGTFEPSAYSVGLGYAKALTDRFSVGGHIKYVSQKLGSSELPGEAGVNTTIDNEVDVLAYDFGTIYRTGYKSLVFGMTVRNFSQEVKYQTEGFQLPLTFKIGLSMNVFDFFLEPDNTHTLLISVDALHPRAYSERINLGGEYVFMDMFAVRGGYMYNYDERDITFGFGFQPKLLGSFRIALDYAYTPFGIFDNVQIMSVRITY